MPTPAFQPLGGDPTTQQIKDYIVKLIRDINYLFANLDNENVVNVAGFLANATEFMSKNGLVGLSSDGADPSSVRFWAGDVKTGNPPYKVTQDGHLFSTLGSIGGWVIGSNTLQDINGMVGMNAGITGGDDIRFWAGSNLSTIAPYRVYESGAAFASNLTVEGGVIRSAPIGSDRIELSGGKFRGITADGSITGLFFDIGAIAGTGIADLFLYHNGSKLLQMYDEITNYRISGMPGGWMNLGSSSSSVNAAGTWNFTNWASVYGTGNGQTLQQVFDNFSSNISAHGSTLSNHESRIYALEHPAPPPGP